MDFNTIIIALISTLSSFIILFVLRSLDLYEKEPYKLIFINFIFGIIAYLVSGIISSLLLNFLNFNSIALESNNIFILLSVIGTAIIMLLSQLTISSISKNFFKKDFDSLPDYLIYFSTIGIGFNFGEVFFFGLLNKTNNPMLLKLSDSLYFSSFFTGSTMPFLLASIGAGIYLLKISKNRNFKNLYKFSIFLISTAIITQILFYSMNYFFIVFPSFVRSDSLDLFKEIKNFANNLSITLLIASLTFAVLFDCYIVTSFMERVITYSKNKELKFDKISNFINPFSYLPLTNLNTFSNLQNSSNLSKKDTKTFIKLALKDFNENGDSSIYIAEALDILSK